MTTLALLVMTDGRSECIEQAIPSATANLHGDITARLIHDDSGDDDYRSWLRRTFPDWTVIGEGHRYGFAGAYARAWLHVRAFDYVFGTEDDFTFNRPVDLYAMTVALSSNPKLAQLALRRQPWNDQERSAGGVVEQHPQDYAETFLTNGTISWLEHRRFFTTNPSLYRGSLCARGWPAGPESEGRFSIDLFADPDVRCGFWGARSSGEWVTHIGRERVGCGY